jgi:hypothetical protein
MGMLLPLVASVGAGFLLEPLDVALAFDPGDQGLVSATGPHRDELAFLNEAGDVVALEAEVGRGLGDVQE